MAKLSTETLSGLVGGFTTNTVTNEPWADQAVKSVHGTTTGPKMVQLFTQQAEVDANLSTGLESDDDWQYDDKRDKGNFPITHAVRIDDNNLYFRSEGVSNIPVGQLDYGSIGVVADGATNTSTVNVVAEQLSTSSSDAFVIASVDTGKAWKVFNGITPATGTSEMWDTDPAPYIGEWIGYDFFNIRPSGAIINKIIISYHTGGYRSANFDVEGSDDGTIWDSLVTGLNSGTDTATHTFTNDTTYRFYRIVNNHGSRVIVSEINFIEASFPAITLVDSINAGGIELLSGVLDLSGSSQGEGLVDIMTAINNGPTDITATQNQDFGERITLTGTDETFSNAIVTVITQNVDLTTLTDFTSYSDGSVTVLGPAISGQSEDPLGIFPGAQIVDTFDNTYHITDITTVEGVSGSDKSHITVLETLPIDAEWEVKRIANVETYSDEGGSDFDTPTFRDTVSFGSGTFVSGSISISNLGSTAQNAISTDDYALTIGSSVKFGINSAVNFDGMGFIKSDIAVDGFNRTDTGIGSFAIFIDGGSATSPAYAYVDGGQVPVNTSNHGTGTFYIEYVGDGNFNFYKNDTTFLGLVSTTLQDGDRVKLTAQSGMISTSCAVYLTDWEEPSLDDGGFRVTSTPSISADKNHFHSLAPNGSEAIITKPSATSQVTNFGFRLPDNSDWAVNLYGEEGYMAFATEFNLDMTPKNCVIYNKTLEQREVIATSIASDRGGIGEDGYWWYRNLSSFTETDISLVETDPVESDPFNIGNYQTNDSTPYTVSASVVRGPTWAAYRAFDGVVSSRYETGSGVTSGWLKIDLGGSNEKIFGRYFLFGDAVGSEPTAWTIEGSNNDSTWDVLDTQSSQQSEVAVGTSYDIDPADWNSYRYYRLNWSASAGSTTQIQTLNFFEVTGQLTFTANYTFSAVVDPNTIVVKDELDASYNTATFGIFDVETNVDGAGFDAPRDLATFINEGDITVTASLDIRLTSQNLEEVSEISIGGTNSTWSPAKDQARAFAEALESSIGNRNPATYFTYQHPSILTQEQWGKLFFGTDKFAPFIGVRSINGGAPEFTNIWAQFASSLKDIKLGTGSVEVAPTIGSTEIQLTNVSGESINGPVVAYILG
jgi:hypothetical protein